MPSITFSATFGNRIRQISISPVAGAQLYHVYSDNFYQGAVTRVNGKFVAHMTLNTELSGDDIGAMLEVMEREFGA